MSEGAASRRSRTGPDLHRLQIAGATAAPSRATLCERFAAQLLTGPPARQPLEVVRRLLAVQGQDPRGVRLAIRARSTGVSATDVDHALSEERSLLITWLARGTLHLVCSEDYHWLHQLTVPPLFTGSARRLAQEGVSPAAAERGVRTIERALADEGPLTRAQLAERLVGARVPTEGQALVQVLMLASLRGVCVRGPMVGRQHAYTLVHDWIPDRGSTAQGTHGRSSFDRDRALAELARRYLAGHGPASARDLAKWAGLPLRDARAGLRAIASELEQREQGLVALAGRDPARELPPARLLGAFDPVLLGWSSREPLVGEHAAIVTTNGLFRPFALVRGRAVGIWKLDGAQVLLEPFGPLPKTTAAALRADARDVIRYLGRSGE